MTRLIVSTNHRGVSHADVSGWLYVIDLERRKVLQESAGIEPPYRMHDINPRGGMRGMRGISICNGELAVANYSSVFFFDRHWHLLRAFTHPSAAGIHEIFCVDDGVWLTSTYNDLLFKFNSAGDVEKIICARAKPIMKLLNGRERQLMKPDQIKSGKLDFRNRTNFNMNFHDGTHLNSIWRGMDGALYFSLGLVTTEKFAVLQDIKSLMQHLRVWDSFVALNRLLLKITGSSSPMFSNLAVQPVTGVSAIIKMTADEQLHIFYVLPKIINPSHSVRFLADGTGIYLDTSNGCVIHFDQQGGTISHTKVTEKFLRGVLELPNGTLALGTSNDLLFYDLKTKRVDEKINLSDEVSNSIFDIKFLPDEFDLPPESFEARIGRMAGFDGQKIIWEQGDRYVA